MKKNIRILLVEDEIIAAMQMKAELQRNGYTVLDFVTTAEDAIERATNERPDLIIMDINLNGPKDGIEAALAIKAVYPAVIVFVTGYVDAAVRERAQKAEPFAYLVKPILAQVLFPLIDSRFAT